MSKKIFPNDHWCKCTPENLAAIVKEFPDTPTYDWTPIAKAVASDPTWSRNTETLYMSDGRLLRSSGGHVGGYNEYVFKPSGDRKLPPNIWFETTPGNIEVLVRMFPDTPVVGENYKAVGELDDAKKLLGAVGYARTDRKGDLWRSTIKDSYMQGWPFSFAKAASERKLPPRVWFEATPENIQALIEKYPETPTVGDAPVGKLADAKSYFQEAKFIRTDCDGDLWRFHSKISQMEGEPFSLGTSEPAEQTNEVKLGPLQYFLSPGDHSKAAKYWGGDVEQYINEYCSTNYYYRKPLFIGVRKDGTIVAYEREQIIIRHGFTDRVSWPGAVVDSDSQQSLPRTVSDVSVGESDMNLTEKELNELVQRVVAAQAKPKSSGVARMVLRKAASLCWIGTKKSLVYTFGPAVGWLRSAACLAALSGLAYGGYKAYNMFDNLPKFTFEQPQEQSPSDN